MVIVTEKKLPTVLIEGADVSKISLVTPATGFVYSGLGPDYRVLARKSRKQAQSYYNIYREVRWDVCVLCVIPLFWETVDIHLSVSCACFIQPV